MTNTALSLIDTIAGTRRELQGDRDRLARLQALQRWQLVRLQRTYQDFYRSQRYHDGLEFFMRDLYGPHDFTRRDRDLRRVLGTWERALPELALQAIVGALELEALTLRLDIEVIDALGDASLNERTYADAYRAIDCREEREQQIALIITAGRALDELIGKAWVRPALRVARTPAKFAGAMELHEFLERGYSAFDKMSGASDLLTAIQQRETLIMERLFAGALNPFDIAPLPAQGVSS